MEYPSTFGIDRAALGRHSPACMKTNTLWILPLLTLAASAAEPEVKLAGLQAVYDDGGKSFGGFKTYNTDAGHSISLIIRSGDKAMVAFDDDKASIKIGGADAKCKSFGGDMAFSKDRLALRLEFSSKGKAQVSEDGKLKVTGDIPITFATGKEETRSEAFTVSVATAVVFPAGKEGMPTLKVKSAGKPKWGNDPFEIAFTTNRKTDEFAGIRFYTKDGKPVDAKRGSSSWMGFAGNGSGEFSYTFKAPQTDLIIAVESWTGREDKKIQVDLSAGLAVP